MTLIQFRILAARCVRGLSISPALERKGAGNVGRSMRPQPRMQNKKAYELVTTVTPETPGHSPRVGFNRLLRALPGDQVCLTPSLTRIAPRKLDANHEASGPHDLAVRRHALRPGARL